MTNLEKIAWEAVQGMNIRTPLVSAVQNKPSILVSYGNEDNSRNLMEIYPEALLGRYSAADVGAFRKEIGGRLRRRNEHG